MSTNPNGYRQRISQAFCIAFTVLVFLQMIFGFVYLFNNYDFIPPYGDTEGYIIFASGMSPLINIRGFLFPFMIRTAMVASDSLFPVPYQTLVYLFQIAVSIFAFWRLLCRCFANITDIRSRRFWVLLSLTYLVFNPVLLHFNMSLMTDGLTLSAVCFFAVGLLDFVNNVHRKRSLTVMFISCLAAAQLRPEKTIVLFLTAVLLMFFLSLKEYFFKKKAGQKAVKLSIVGSRKWLAAMLAVLVLCSVANNVVWRATHGGKDYTDDGEPTMSASAQLFGMVTHTRLAFAWQYLPEEIKEIVSYDDAVKYSDGAHKRWMINKLLDGGGDRYLIKVTAIVFTHYPGQVLYSAGKTFAQYCLSPLVSIHEYYYLLIPSLQIGESWQRWTYTRMEMGTPGLTRAYWEVSMLPLLLLLSAFAVSLKKSRGLLSDPSVLCLAALLLANAMLFACSALGTFHIRYALPCYMAFLVIAFISVAKTVFVGTQNTPDGARPHIAKHRGSKG